MITTLFGLGVLLALAPAAPPGIQSLLFGDPLAITRERPRRRPRCCACSPLAALAVLHRALLAIGFDRSSAGALGLRPFRVELALIALVAVAILVSVQALGNLLVVAILIAPAATARLLARGLPRDDGRRRRDRGSRARSAASTSPTTRGSPAGASIALVLVGAYFSVFALGEFAKMRAAIISA